MDRHDPLSLAVPATKNQTPKGKISMPEKVTVALTREKECKHSVRFAEAGDSANHVVGTPMPCSPATSPPTTTAICASTSPCATNWPARRLKPRNNFQQINSCHLLGVA